MANLDLKAIKELRERTQAGMGDCKNAYVEAEGDLEKAVEIILKKGLAKSAKRAGAVAAEGEVAAEVFADGRAAVMAEVNIQTDFSARNEMFKKYVTQVIEKAKATPRGAVLTEQQVDGKTLADLATEITARLGEKVAVRRWERFELPEGANGFCHSYVHLGGKIGVLVQVTTSTAEAASHQAVRSFADNAAMHIAAMNPSALGRADIAEADVAKQREIFEAQLREDPKPKPEAMWTKIVDGKVEKWFSEVVLLEQESVVEPGNKLDALRRAAGEAAGADVQLTAFARYERGEGFEKKSADLAKDVAGMLGG